MLSCLGCLGIIFLFFASAIVVGTVNALTGNVPETTSATSASSSATSASASPAPTATSPSPSSAKPTVTSAKPSPSETTPTAVPLDKETNLIAAPAADTSTSSNAQAAIEKLETLPVKGRASKSGYNRDLFGPAWADVDRNGCDTRNDILRRDLTSITVKPGTRGCKVMTGALADPYTATTIGFKQGKNTSSEVQIDHVVALSDAWQTGAQDLSPSERERFANDPINLLAVDGDANQQKSDGDAATWLPANKDFRCTYVSKQIDVKAQYRLWVKQAEKDAMIRVLNNCGAELPQESPAPVVEEPSEMPAPKATEPAYVAPPVEQAPAPTVPEEQAPPAPVAPVAPPGGPVFANCDEARAAGAAPLYAGSPGYAPKLDGDKDGVACESKK